MLGRRIYVLVTAFLLLTVPLHARSQPKEIRVLSYNIHHGRGTDGEINLARTARAIRSVDPDLVALQEVDVETERSGGINQIVALAQRTGMAYVFGDNLDYQGGDYGNAILFDLPITSHENHLLPNLNGPPRRSALEAVVTVNGTSIGFLSAHLDYQDKENRLGEVRAINQLLEESDHPMILAGDINALFDTETLQLLELAWMNTVDKPHFTFPAENPERQIDYVMGHPEERWEVKEVRVLDSNASDHRPLLVVLELRT